MITLSQTRTYKKKSHKTIIFCPREIIMNKNIILLILFFIPTGLNATQSFVTKKKKTVSCATLKNNCCDACTDILETSAKLIENSAARQLTLDEKNVTLLAMIKDLSILQQLMLGKIRSIIEGTQNCFFALATKAQLKECGDKTTSCHEELIAIDTKIKNKTHTSTQLKTAHTQLLEYITYIKTL